MENKKTILIKISGASLKTGDAAFDKQKINNLCEQIQWLQRKYNVGIVIGGGNIFRGNLASEFGLKRSDADYMGMLSTMINGMMLQNVLENYGVRTRIYSAIEINAVCEPYIIRKVQKSIGEGDVCIYVAGTGSPYVTTDTGAALRACQIEADIMMMGKNGVDGVYSADPNKNPNAIRYEHLTYHDVIAKKLQVMDSSALSLCEEQNIEILVFNIDEENAFINAIEGKIPVTTISQEKK